MRAFGGLARYRGDAPVRVWLLAIARRVCADHVRRRQRRRRLLDRVGRHPGDRAVPAPEVVDDLLGALAADRREAFVLTQLVGLSYEEAAAVVGCPIGTIRSRVARARGRPDGDRRPGRRPLTRSAARPRRRSTTATRGAGDHDGGDDEGDDPAGRAAAAVRRSMVVVVVGGRRRGRRAAVVGGRRRRGRGVGGRLVVVAARWSSSRPPWSSGPWSPARSVVAGAAPPSSSLPRRSGRRRAGRARVRRRGRRRGWRPATSRRPARAPAGPATRRRAPVSIHASCSPFSHCCTAGNASRVPTASGTGKLTWKAPASSAGCDPPDHSSTVVPSAFGVDVAVHPSALDGRGAGDGRLHPHVDRRGVAAPVLGLERHRRRAAGRHGDEVGLGVRRGDRGRRDDRHQAGGDGDGQAAGNGGRGVRSQVQGRPRTGRGSRHRHSSQWTSVIGRPATRSPTHWTNGTPLTVSV